MRAFHFCGVLSPALLFCFTSILPQARAFPVAEPFAAMPVWDSTYAANWGPDAEFGIEPGGEEGTGLHAHMDGEGWSARVLVYSVTPGTGVVLGISRRCPLSSYIMETGYRAGRHTAENWFQQGDRWQILQAFDASESWSPDGDTWTRHEAYLDIGDSTEISVGFKLRNRSGCGHTGVTWDNLSLAEGAPITPAPTSPPTVTPVPRTFPSSAPAGLIRLVWWNIEFLGSRDPLRTPEQLDALAARMVGFDAAVFALQEIAEPDTFEYVRSRMGPQWATFRLASQNALLYDTSKVEGFSFERLDALAQPPYTAYPQGTGRRPVTGVFRSLAGTGETFRVISVHCHPFEEYESTRAEEGRWLGAKVLEYLGTPGETPSIFIVGDYNGTVPHPPHCELVDGSGLYRLRKENGESTLPLHWTGIDHVALTRDAWLQLPIRTAFVIRPEHYGETGTEFEATYSDHLPVFVELGRLAPALLMVW